MFKTKRENEIPLLTDDEIAILAASLEDPSIATRYFFKPVGGPGWEFDRNFRAGKEWQLDALLASQSDIIILGGFGTGKTTWFSMGAAYFAMTTHPDFKFMNAAPTMRQAMYGYRAVLAAARGTRFEDMIFSAPESPYPKIELRFKIGFETVVSTMEFMSVADNADSVYGWEGDWVNLDEAFKLDDLEDVYIVLGSRIRGSVSGRERLGRISFTTNSHDNAFGWYLVDIAREDPENYLLLQVDTRDNLNVTEKQVERMTARIPPAERERWLAANRPEGRGNYFDKVSVIACEDVEYSKKIFDSVVAGIDGYDARRSSKAGVSYLHVPRVAGRIYEMYGDLGTDNAPNRNSPVITVWDITSVPQNPAQLVAFWWGSGNGSIKPFFGTLIRLILDYRPTFIAVDSTGTQKGTAEMLNSVVRARRITDEEILVWLGPYVNKEGIVVLPRGISIAGMDFSSGRKDMFLRALQQMIEARQLSWPSMLTGIRSQITNYDRMKDNARATNKIPNDVVAAFSMAAFAFRRYFNVEPEDEFPEDEEENSKVASAKGREDRRSAAREARSAVSR